MPPTGQLQQILRPGDQSVRDANGTVTTFAGLPVVSNIGTVLAEWGVVLGLYGKGGVGKTTLACTLANRNLNPDGNDLPLGILDAEAGVKSVAHLVGPDLQDLPLGTFADLEKFIAGAKATPPDKFPWRTLLVDNLSEFVNKCLREYGYHGMNNVVSSQPDYNAMTTKVTDAVRDLRDLAQTHKCNVIFNLWEATDKTESGVVLAYKADVTPKLGIRLVGMLDYIGYLTVMKDPPRFTRKLTFQPNEAGVNLDAKMRRRPDEVAAQIPMELYNPNLVDIFNTIRRGEAFPVDKFRRPVSQTGR